MDDKITAANTDISAGRIACGNTAYKRAVSDFYPTPPEATDALLRFLQLRRYTRIWECACGLGHMTKVMQNWGCRVIATDIQSGTDFLTAPLPDCDWIITNPPFSQSQAFIQRCIEHERPFALLLKSQYWHAKKRLELFRQHQPMYVLPLTWRPDFLFGARGGASLMDVIWVVWGDGPAKHTEYIPLERMERSGQR